MPNQVKKEIALLDGDADAGEDMDQLLAGQPFCVTHVNTVAECEAYFRNHSCCALILDLDTVEIDNRTIVNLKKAHPEIAIIAKSDRKFHPELEESLRSHIFACLSKPLDPLELKFWLRSLKTSNGCQ